jgi:hypothetical protein
MKQLYIIHNQLFILLFLTVITTNYTFAQTHSSSCLTDLLHEEKLNQDLSYLKKYQQGQERTYQQIKKILEYRAKNPHMAHLTPATYTIPVVVHIIHSGGTENISDATVQAGIQHLNDAFRHVAPLNGRAGLFEKRC